MTQKKGKNGNLYRNLVELIAVGSVTGSFAGFVVTIFNIFVRKGEELSRNAYGYIRENPVLIPLLLLALLAAIFLVGVAMRFSTVIRGGGVPQAEGASRGIVPLKWWRDLTLMFAATLINVFTGLSVGAEGPSVLIGACMGDGVAKGCKRNEMIRKYQITGGACAGLAVAINAPLMGMAFAFEEAHKRFTPEVFICAFTSVIFGMLTRIAIYAALGMEVVNSFGSYLFYELPMKYYLFVVVAGVVCSILGIAFYKLCFVFRGYFKKIKAKNPQHTLFLRVAIVMAVGAVISLVAADVMGGGHHLIESLGTFGGTSSPEIFGVFSLSFVGAVCVILLLKFFITTLNVGAGLPCGILIPLLAIGACMGVLLNQIWLALGMESKYCDLMVMICMAAFFTTVVKAPITSIVMICEFTGSFAPLLPVIIAVAIGYTIGELAKTDSIYEELLELYEEENGLHEREMEEVFTLTVQEGALADRRELRNVLWPSGARVTEIRRGEQRILPSGDSILRGGDILVIVCKTSEPQKTLDELNHILS